MKSVSQPTALTLLDLRQGYIAFQLQKFTLAVDSSGKIQVKPVTLGRDFGTKSEILRGMAAGDRVVQNPTQDLHAGMTVSVQPVDNQTGG
jgi:membrane fusion protein (multidrug efflux system)